MGEIRRKQAVKLLQPKLSLAWGIPKKGILWENNVRCLGSLGIELPRHSFNKCGDLLCGPNIGRTVLNNTKRSP